MNKSSKNKENSHVKKRIVAYISKEMLNWLEKKAGDLQSTPSGFLRLLIHNSMQRENLNE